MKKIFAIAWKDAIIRFASSSELLFFIILPIVFTFLLAGGTPQGDEDPRISLLVVDEAQTTISTRIIDELENSTAVRPEMLTRAEAQKQFDDRRADAVFFIPAGIDIESLQDSSAEVELLQQPNNINATIAERAVLTAIRRVSSAISAAQNAVSVRESKQPFASDAEKQTYFENSLEMAQTIQADAPERVTVVQGLTEDQVDYDPRANSSAGQLITWVFIPLFGISALFAYERQQG
ncbi:MAG TPA: ABC transporter permease, partial [Anaerolineales bacterium]|nr:ABC transporter permease [Anaerolineales bacterium]